MNNEKKDPFSWLAVVLLLLFLVGLDGFVNKVN